MNKPVAVIISDVHYSLQNLKLADASMRMAISKANELRVPLIVAGDLHDTKANLRGECVNAMVETFRYANSPPHVLIGNHDKINEKSEEHSLKFLAAYAALIDYLPLSTLRNVGYLIPYQHDPNILKSYLRKLPKNSTLIMHQGLEGSHMGDYIQDKSAISHEDVTGFRVISGHYHARQTIDLPNGGKWDYIGNPYTTSYGEANDLPKGFQILMDDGSLEFVPTDLRSHIVIDTVVSELVAIPYTHKPGDLLWFKCRGTHEELSRINRRFIADNYGIEEGFKLDLIPLSGISEKPSRQLGNVELMDKLIDSLTNTSDERKLKLKELWRHLGS